AADGAARADQRHVRGPVAGGRGVVQVERVGAGVDERLVERDGEPCRRWREGGDHGALGGERVAGAGDAAGEDGGGGQGLAPAGGHRGAEGRASAGQRAVSGQGGGAVGAAEVNGAGVACCGVVERVPGGDREVERRAGGDAAGGADAQARGGGGAHAE